MKHFFLPILGLMASFIISGCGGEKPTCNDIQATLDESVEHAMAVLKDMNNAADLEKNKQKIEEIKNKFKDKLCQAITNTSATKCEINFKGSGKQEMTKDEMKKHFGCQ